MENKAKKYIKPELVKHRNLKEMTFSDSEWQSSVAVSNSYRRGSLERH